MSDDDVETLKKRIELFEEQGWEAQAEDAREELEELTEETDTSYPRNIPVLESAEEIVAAARSDADSIDELREDVERSDDAEELTKEALEEQIAVFERKGWTEQAEQAREELEQLD